MPDELTIDDPPFGVVLLNFGDPRFPRLQSKTHGLSLAESIFLRIIAYLPFAEAVAIPTRHIVDGAEMGGAMLWAEPLLRAGVVHPLLRETSESCEDYARERKLAAAAMQRAAFLDGAASHLRRFRTEALSPTYRSLLADDLKSDGAFRRAFPGSIRGRHREALDHAWRAFSESGEAVPESFVSIVQRFCRPASRMASRWAMARYYHTPLRFDDSTTREIPSAAAEILQRGGVLAPHMRPLDFPPPAQATLNRLAVSLPPDSVQAYSRQWCDAVLLVRERIPQARALFRETLDTAAVTEAGQVVEAALADELSAQLRQRPSKDRAYTLIAALLAGAVSAGVDLAAGWGLGAPAGVTGGAVGVGVAVAANEIQKSRGDERDRHERPWAMAIDELDSYAGTFGDRRSGPVTRVRAAQST